MAQRRREREGEDPPYWLGAILVLIAGLGAAIAADAEVYRPLFRVIVRGLWITVWVTGMSFALACLLGLGLAMLARAARWRCASSRASTSS